jgi:hypothetical protein
MKVTLDLSKLVEEGKISPAEADRLQSLAARDTGTLGINILIGFGVVAVVAGAVALVPTPATALVIGAVVFAAGLGLIFAHNQAWEVLAQICVVIGALMMAGAVIALGRGSVASALLVAIGLCAAAIIARSSLLMAAAVLALGASLGARAGYWHATYALAIYEPLLTIVLFSLVAYGAYQASKRLAADYERLALAAARTAVFMVNFGFWIGSLWGDRLLLLRALFQGDLTGEARYTIVVPSVYFIVGWALALIAAGLWAMRVNRRWMVNVVAVFAAIHFYTQWFEKLGATPLSVLIGGILVLAFALWLWRFNRGAEGAAP